jgi:hypothetical protein
MSYNDSDDGLRRGIESGFSKGGSGNEYFPREKGEYEDDDAGAEAGLIDNGDGMSGGSNCEVGRGRRFIGLKFVFFW